MHGDHANYNVATGIATVDGAVKMTRDNNQMNGGFAVVNVNSGISRLYGSAPVRRSQMRRKAQHRRCAFKALPALTPTKRGRIRQRRRYPRHRRRHTNVTRHDAMTTGAQRALTDAPP